MAESPSLAHNYLNINHLHTCANNAALLIGGSGSCGIAQAHSHSFALPTQHRLSSQRCHDAHLFCLLCLLLACPLFMLLRRRRSNITCLTIPAPIRAARQGILQEERQSHASRTGIVKSLSAAVVHAFLSLHFFAVSLLSNLPASQPGQPTCSLAWPTLVAYQR